MKRLAYWGAVCFGSALCAFAVSVALGQSKVSVRAGGTNVQMQPVRHEPLGVFGGSLGSYLTIEGILDDQFMMGLGAGNALRVDTVNGRKLAQPIFIPVDNVALPAGKRCVLKGYELGRMIGRPPAQYEADKEQGLDADELVKNVQGVWRWSPYFVVLIAAEPKGLKIRQPR